MDTTTDMVSTEGFGLAIQPSKLPSIKGCLSEVLTPFNLNFPCSQ